jgi:nicotinamide phosphoribosyltransferase
MSDFIMLTDGYKIGHKDQYPTGTQYVYSNFTARSTRIGGADSVTFLGLQYFQQRYLKEIAEATFFSRPRYDVADNYRAFLDSYVGQNSIGVEHIEALHRLGYIPLEFWALPEGLAVPFRVPMFTLQNTHPEFFWVTNYIETLMSSVLWLPCTSASTARRYRRILETYAELTGGDPEFINWQGHDFSFRGMACPEAAALSGAGHLLSFTGTDSIPSIQLLKEYYSGEGLIGGSVPATEHSVMCAGGKEDELETFRRLLRLYPSGILSVVSDTWDLWKVIGELLPALRSEIMSRPGKLVIRPDSGDPVLILTGDASATPGSLAHKGVVQALWDLFGGTTNAKGFRELDSHIGTIYGDSITEARAQQICERLMAKGFASTNVVFGIGSYCVDPETPILCADLTWRRADSLQVGQEIIAFDEDPSFGNNRRVARRYRTAVIEENSIAVKNCSEITTDIGDPVTASHDHPWLVWATNRTAPRVFLNGIPKNHRGVYRTAGLQWKQTHELKVGDKIAFFGRPWQREESRSAGWLSGMFDGEGSLSRATGSGVTRIPHYKVNISQNPGPLLDRLRSELKRRGFSFYEAKRSCPQLVLTGGWAETLRFLGQIAPDRLIAKLPTVLAELPGLFRDKTFTLATVTSVTSIGESHVSSIRTSARTFITGGYLSHNTYQYVTRDTNGFAVKATWAMVNGQERMLHKDPVTDNGGKRSARGRIVVRRGRGGALEMIDGLTLEQQKEYDRENLLISVWRNGQFVHRNTLQAIRGRVAEKGR